MLSDACEDPRLAGRLLGIHLEGPFISPHRGAVGTHPVKCVRPPDASLVADGIDGCALLDKWQALARGKLKLLTIAPEAPGAGALCAHATRAMGLTVSLGHMLASAEAISAATDAGASLLTHLGNGCPNEIHRHRNHLWPCLTDDRLSAMLITDGQHLPADALCAMVRCKGLDRVIVTSDVAPVGGLPDGVYECFGGHVHVEGRYVRSSDKSCLAGSGALMIDCMNHLASLGLRPRAGVAHALDVDELLQVGVDNPLLAIGLRPEEVMRQLAAQHGVEPRVAYEGGRFRLLGEAASRAREPVELTYCAPCE